MRVYPHQVWPRKADLAGFLGVYRPFAAASLHHNLAIVTDYPQ
jgi:hypothetical protein